MSFAKEGVTITLLRAICDIILKDANNIHWTTTDVNNNIIMPLTKELKCSFATMLKTTALSVPHKEVGVLYADAIKPSAKIFISHAWKYELYLKFTITHY